MKRRLIPIIAILIGLIFFLAPTSSDAQAGIVANVITSFAGAAVGSIAWVISYIIGVIGGALFNLGGFFINLMLGLNYQILDKDQNLVLYTGWTIVRDVANLGFVLVIIVIAFTTILRIKEWETSKLLPKLIAAAIIVNFSLAIGGAIINFTNFLTDFFFGRISANAFDIASSLANAFNPQEFFAGLIKNPDSAITAMNSLESAINGILGIVFTSLFTFAGALTLIFYAFLLLIRFIYLTILLIISPIVWLFWVIPKLADNFKNWWDSFLKWTFFAPASAFFIYLTLYTVFQLRDQHRRLGANVSAIKFASGPLVDIFSTGAQMVVLIGLMIGGLIIAEKLSITFAKNMVNATEAGTKGFAAWFGRKGVRGATAPLRAVQLPARLRLAGTKMQAAGRQKMLGPNVLQRTVGRIQYGLGGRFKTTGTKMHQAGAGLNLWQSTVSTAKAGWKKKKLVQAQEQ